MCCSPQTKAIVHTPTSVHLFSQEDEHNSDYIYLARPKKEVILMGSRAFNNLLASIQAKIGNLNKTITVLQRHAISYKRKVNASDAQAATDLMANAVNMKNKTEMIEALKVFFIMMKND